MEKKYEELENWQKELLDKAESVMKNAFNLFSHFYVGAAVLTDDGEVFLGTFVENSSMAAICAERIAIFSANTKGKRKFKAVAVIGAGEKFDCKDPVVPCGDCRQTIYDFSQINDKDVIVICSNTKKDKIIVTSISKLLPNAFGPKDVGQDIERFR